MRASRFRVVGLFALSLLVLSVILLQARPRTPPAPRPRLAVLVVLDQFRGDYLARWGRLFGKGGFNRLTAGGAWFTDCHYPYASTMTGPGHATLATGCPPARHGIVGNNWYERAEGDVYCAAARRELGAGSGGGGRRGRGASPERLLSPTLADALKEATRGQARVVSLSLKDRSSVLPGGKHPDACYWADGSGRFVTSPYYRATPHPWVAEFNATGAANAWRGKTWQRLRPDLDYVRCSGPDDQRGEGRGANQGRTFPHPFGGGTGGGRRDPYAGAVACSPAGNDLLLALVKRAVEAENLGRGDAPDLLCVSFSSNDLVGHAWGPDSQEVLDITLRTDRLIADLLDFLDARVGRGRYTLALSADHGICPLPEVARAAGHPNARRVPQGPILAAAQKRLDEAFPGPPGGQARAGRWVERGADNMLYLNHKLVAARKVAQASVEKELARFLAQQPGLCAAYTRTELLSGAKLDAVGEAVRTSFHPERSGDVMPVIEPYCLFGSEFATGTTHGTPHDYDTYVPLLVYGPGVRPGLHRERVSPELAAVVLAQALGVRPPADARPRTPEGLFAGGGN
jgi:hypothetical protein